MFKIWDPQIKIIDSLGYGFENSLQIRFGNSGRPIPNGVVGHETFCNVFTNWVVSPVFANELPIGSLRCLPVRTLVVQEAQ